MVLKSLAMFGLVAVLVVIVACSIAINYDSRPSWEVEGDKGSIRVELKGR